MKAAFNRLAYLEVYHESLAVARRGRIYLGAFGQGTRFLIEKLDAQLFKALCEGTRNLFPKTVYDGTEVEGVLRLLKAAQTWIHKCELICSQPMRRKTIATVEDYFACVRSTLDGGDGERKAAIIGLGKPWDHWTVVRRVDRRRAVFFDSWGFPRTTGFD